MNNPSDEQVAIIDATTVGSHLVCDAVAGAGKTTTVLWVARANPQKHVMQITYNAQLKEEVRRKAIDYDIPIEIHTYHSLAVKYYNPLAYTDNVIKHIIASDAPCKHKIAVPDILVIDEAQDMTPLLFKLIRKYMRDIQNPNLQLLVFGDRNQSVYEFKNADARFLTMADAIYANLIGVDKQTEHKGLRSSYRITNQIAWFVNNVMLDRQYIAAKKSGPPITYFKCNPFMSATKLVLGELLPLLMRGRISPGDIFVLVGSIRSKNLGAPYRKLENALVAAGVPCYVPNNDDGPMNKDAINDKVVFTTFHQAKGRERRVVVIYGFDASYFKFYARTKSPNICPSELYVGVTRSSERLILIESGDGALPFLNYPALRDAPEDIIRYIDLKPKPSFRDDLLSKNTIATPTDLVRFLKDDAIAFCSNIVNELFYTVAAADTTDIVQIPSSIECASGIEDVSAINGLAIPILWGATVSSIWKSTWGAASASAIQDSMRDAIREEIKHSRDPLMSEFASYIKNPCETIDDYLLLCNVYKAAVDQIHCQLAQIDRYDWLTMEMVDSCHIHMFKHLRKDCQYEIPIASRGAHRSAIMRFFTDKIADRKLLAIAKMLEFSGRIDAAEMGPDAEYTSIFEFKCTNELTLEHKLQLVVYAWMWKMFSDSDAPMPAFKLLNIKTGELLLLDAESDLVDDVICALVANKYGSTDAISDEEFLARLED